MYLISKEKALRGTGQRQRTWPARGCRRCWGGGGRPGWRPTARTILQPPVFQMISKCLRLICGISKGKIQIDAKKMKLWPCRQPRSAPSGRRQAPGQRGGRQGWSQPGRPAWRTSPGKRSHVALSEYLDDENVLAKLLQSWLWKVCTIIDSVLILSWREAPGNSSNSILFFFTLFQSFFNPFSIPFLFHTLLILPTSVSDFFRVQFVFLSPKTWISVLDLLQCFMLAGNFSGISGHMQNSNCHRFHYN